MPTIAFGEQHLLRLAPTGSGGGMFAGEGRHALGESIDLASKVGLLAVETVNLGLQRAHRRQHRCTHDG